MIQFISDRIVTLPELERCDGWHKLISMNKSSLLPIVRFGTKEFAASLSRMKRRNPVVSDEVLSRVARIMSAVREGGDAAIVEFTRELDRVILRKLEIAKKEIARSESYVSEEMLDVLREAIVNVRTFHEKQRSSSWSDEREDGTILGQRVIPLERVAIYVPGGTAAYPSTLIMSAVPAQVAGVDEIYVLTPPGKDGTVNRLVLATCHLLGISTVYSIGGAQAIAAAAYGTKTIKKADKIVGPGNVFVAAAKKFVYGEVDIDMIAGPSEVVVLADSSADAGEVAADLLAQAEHDANAAAVLITTDAKLARRVREKVEDFLPGLDRRDIASESLRNNGVVFIVKDISQGVSLVNGIAPEHLEIVTRNSSDVLPKIRNAGAVFVGRYSPEPVGDYFAGPSHVLPTGGTARFSSVLSVDTFLKRSSVIQYSKKAFLRDAKKVKLFAESEGLTAHALSIEVRKEIGR